MEAGQIDLTVVRDLIHCRSSRVLGLFNEPVDHAEAEPVLADFLGREERLEDLVEARVACRYRHRLSRAHILSRGDLRAACGIGLVQPRIADLNR